MTTPGESRRVTEAERARHPLESWADGARKWLMVNSDGVTPYVVRDGVQHCRAAFYDAKLEAVQLDATKMTPRFVALLEHHYGESIVSLTQCVSFEYAAASTTVDVANEVGEPSSPWETDETGGMPCFDSL